MAKPDKSTPDTDVQTTSIDKATTGQQNESTEPVTAPEVNQTSTETDTTQSLSEKVDSVIEKAIDGAESLIEKAAEAAGSAVDKAAEVVKNAVNTLAGRVEVELNDAKSGTHTIFHSRGFTDFIDGKATVLREIADELRQFGQIKGAE